MKQALPFSKKTDEKKEVLSYAFQIILTSILTSTVEKITCKC